MAQADTKAGTTKGSMRIPYANIADKSTTRSHCMKCRFVVRLTGFSLLLLVITSLPFASAQAPATRSTSLQVAGLTDAVTVRRDERGIPYIEAKNDADLYF